MAVLFVTGNRIHHSDVHPTVVVPYFGKTAVLDSVKLNLGIQGLRPRMVKLERDLSYDQLFRELWEKGEPFILVEHDIVPWPGGCTGIVDVPGAVVRVPLLGIRAIEVLPRLYQVRSVALGRLPSARRIAVVASHGSEDRGRAAEAGAQRAPAFACGFPSQFRARQANEHLSRAPELLG